MELTTGEVLGRRLHAQHLDAPLGPGGLLEAAGACGFQNTPPGAWELAAINRVEGVSAAGLRAALYEEKSLLQAWSLRGAPYVFPTEEAGVFSCLLPPVRARSPGYTRAASRLRWTASAWALTSCCP